MALYANGKRIDVAGLDAANTWTAVQAFSQGINIGEDKHIGISASAERFLFDGSGGNVSLLGANLGVNIEAPAVRFHVKDSVNILGEFETTSSRAAVFVTTPGALNDAAEINFGKDAQLSSNFQTGIIGAIVTQASPLKSDMRFNVNAGNSMFEVARFTSSARLGVMVSSPANRLDIGAGAMRMEEMTAPGAPAVNSVVVFAEDNGSGKTRLMARFNTGAVQQLAIEP